MALEIETTQFLTGEYDEDYDYEANVAPKLRIDFAKYGKKRNNEKEEEETSGTDSLPPDIYCDLVNTLNQKWVNHTTSKHNYTKTKILLNNAKLNNFPDAFCTHFWRLGATMRI